MSKILVDQDVLAEVLHELLMRTGDDRKARHYNPEISDPFLYQTVKKIYQIMDEDQLWSHYDRINGCNGNPRTEAEEEAAFQAYIKLTDEEFTKARQNGFKFPYDEE